MYLFLGKENKSGNWMKSLKYHAANLITRPNLTSNFIKIPQVAYVLVANLLTNISNVGCQLWKLRGIGIISCPGMVNKNWYSFEKQKRKKTDKYFHGPITKAPSDTWCNVKFSFCLTSKYKAIWKENLVVNQMSLRAFIPCTPTILVLTHLEGGRTSSSKFQIFCSPQPAYSQKVVNSSMCLPLQPTCSKTHRNACYTG